MNISSWASLYDGFYEKMPWIRSGVFTVYRKNGNHRIPQAAETRFWMLGNTLLRLDVILPAPTGKQKREITDKLLQEMPELKRAEINVSACHKFDRLQQPVKYNISAAQAYFRAMGYAYDQDPFGVFYIDPFPEENTNGKPDFLQISFRHKAYPGCRKLISIRQDDTLLPEPQTNSGNPSENVFFSNQRLNR